MKYLSASPISFPLLLALILSLAATMAAQAEENGRAIMTRVYNRADGDDRHSEITMTLVNKQGRQRVRVMESFSKDYGKDRKTIMIFREPADVKGTMFLSWEYDALGRDDDKWLYMPAMKKDRRISGTSRNEYFMGSDFTYDDMDKRQPEKDEQTVLGEEEYKGHRCWKIECIPIGPELYAKRTVLVSQEALLVLKSEYFDKDGLLKVYEATDFRKQDGFWNVYTGVMTNVARDHKTILKTAFMRYNTGLEDSLFTVTTLQRGRL